VGIIDGTLIPFATRPIRYDEDYCSWKTTYIISTMIVCNKKGGILLVFLRLFMILEFTQFQNCGRIQGIFFCEEEHLLVESTYPFLLISIPIYKQLVTTQPLNVIFNTQLAKLS
jgi:hypothetical protein